MTALAGDTAVDELDALLEGAGERGFRWYRFGEDQNGPEVLAGVLRWRSGCADVLVLIDDEQSHAYRAPSDPKSDVFAPSRVYWWYGRSDQVGMVWVMRALLALPRHPIPAFLVTGDPKEME